MSFQSHEQIMMEQFNLVKSDFELWAELYNKTHQQKCLTEAAQRWGILCGLAMAADQFGIHSLQDALDTMAPPMHPDRPSEIEESV